MGARLDVADDWPLLSCQTKEASNGLLLGFARAEENIALSRLCALSFVLGHGSWPIQSSQHQVISGAAVGGTFFS